MEFRKEKVSATLGMAIVLIHIFMSFYLWFVFSKIADPVVAIEKISLPLTIGYSVSIVNWFIKNQGKFVKVDTVGLSYVALVAAIATPFLIAMIAGPQLYLSNALSPTQLNQFYVFIESAFGVLFVLIFNDLFDTSVSQG